MKDKIKQFLQETKLFQKELALMVGASECHMSHWIAGKYKPSRLYKEKILETMFRCQNDKEWLEQWIDKNREMKSKENAKKLLQSYKRRDNM
jgi:DNA-binding XRE family transcriptional regulator